MDDLVKHEERRALTREEAAGVLRDLADSLARHNGIEMDRGGVRWSVPVPDEVELELEVEVGTDGSSIEVEISW